MLVFRKVGGIEAGNLVKIGDFIKCIEEVVCTHSCLTLEEGQPEDLSVFSLKAGHYF